MALKYPYGKEKIAAAMNALATSQGEIKERLFNAFIAMHTITPERDLPKKLRKDYIELSERLTKDEARFEGEGKLKATLDNMPEIDARDCAQTIVNLFWEIFNVKY